MLHEFRVSCIDIRNAALTIMEHTAGLDFAGFKASKLHRDAVIRQFTVLGEAASRVGKVVREQHPQVQWVKMIGMRNALIHGYDKIRLETVWHTAVRFVPQVVEQFEQILQEME